MPGPGAAKAVVTAKPLGEKKGDKIKIFKYRPKSGYARARVIASFSMLEITDVSLDGKPAREGGSRRLRRPPRPTRSPPGQATPRGATAKKPTAKKPTAKKPTAKKPTTKKTTKKTTGEET